MKGLILILISITPWLCTVRRWLKINSELNHSCLNNSKTLCIACRQMQTWLYRRKPRWAFMLWQWAAKLNNHSIKSNYGIHCCILLVSSLLLTGCGQVALKKVVDQWLQMDNTARVEVRRAAQLLVDDVVCQESILSFIYYGTISHMSYRHRPIMVPPLSLSPGSRLGDSTW